MTSLYFLMFLPYYGRYVKTHSTNDISRWERTQNRMAEWEFTASSASHPRPAHLLIRSKRSKTPYLVWPAGWSNFSPIVEPMLLFRHIGYFNSASAGLVGSSQSWKVLKLLETQKFHCQFRWFDKVWVRTGSLLTIYQSRKLTAHLMLRAGW